MNNDYLNDEMEIDLLELLKCLLKNIKKIVICTFACGLVAFVLSAFILPKSYVSSADITIHPQGELLDYTSYLVGDRVLNDVGSKLKMDSSSLNESIVVTRDSNNSYNYNIAVTTNDSNLSYKVVNEVIKAFEKELSGELNLYGITTLNEAQVNNVPVSPNVKKNTIIGVLVGFTIGVAYFVLCFLFDKHFKNKDEVEAYLGVDVLAEIPVNK